MKFKYYSGVVKHSPHVAVSDINAFIYLEGKCDNHN